MVNTDLIASFLAVDEAASILGFAVVISALAVDVAASTLVRAVVISALAVDDAPSVLVRAEVSISAEIFASDLGLGGGFHRILRLPPPVTTG